MAHNILVLNGHPDPDSRGLCHALAEAYIEGAQDEGHLVQRLDVARLPFGFLRSQAEFEKGVVPASIATAQSELLRADHLVVVFPLWLGSMPALLKAFFEHALRPGFAFEDRRHGFPVARLRGRSARMIVTMGMPALVYRWYYGGHGVRNLKRNVLGFVGYAPIRTTMVGSLAMRSGESLERVVDDVKALGSSAR